MESLTCLQMPAPLPPMQDRNSTVPTSNETPQGKVFVFKSNGFFWRFASIHKSTLLIYLFAVCSLLSPETPFFYESIAVLMAALTLSSYMKIASLSARLVGGVVVVWCGGPTSLSPPPGRTSENFFKSKKFP